MNLITKAHLEGLEELEKLWFNEHGKPFVFKRNVISFLTTYTENLLKAVKESGPGEMHSHLDPAFTKPEQEDLKTDREQVIFGRGNNYSRTSFISAIDEGIEGIKKGGL